MLIGLFFLFLKYGWLWDFSGSLAVKTSPSNAMGSFVREQRSYMPHGKKKKTKKQKTEKILQQIQ